MPSATHRAWFISLLAALVGCGAETTAPPSDASRADAPVDVPRDVPVDATPDAAIMCNGTSATIFPTFDRTCSVDTDCFVAQHQTDCCGNSRALGLAVRERDAFTAAERVCSAMYPGCGCPARPPVADDGMTGLPPAMIVAACRSGLCTSFVR